MILSHLLQVKPFSQWEKLDMSSLERRKLLCSVSFHLIAVICVVWSLYVLIDRTADEIRTGISSNRPLTLWCQLEDMFQLIVTPQGIGKVMIQLKDTPSKVYAIGAELFLSKVPLEVLQN